MRPFVSDEDPRVDARLRREGRWHYPVEALREGIVNALAHRDWTCRGVTQVVRYSDRLEILSPGALQNSMSVGKMLAGLRLARNPRIVDVLRNCGYGDPRGMGVRKKIVPQMRTLNGTEPEFIVTEDYLKLVVHRARV